MKKLLASGHCYIKQPPFILDRAIIPFGVFDDFRRNQVPNPIPSFRRGKPVSQSRQKHYRPLAAFRLMDGRHLYCIRDDVVTVFRPFTIRILGFIVKKFCKSIKPIHRFRGEVDGLPIRNDLAEPSEIEEYNLSAVVRNVLFAYFRPLQKFQEYLLYAR